MNIWHPYTQHALAESEMEIKSAQGAYLFPSNGQKILDAISSWWVTLHGHSHPTITKAISYQASQLDQVILAGFTHKPAQQLAQELVRHVPTGLNYTFFSDNGSTAVEVGLKMAINFHENKGFPRKRIVALEGAYHGDTFGAMSVSGRSMFTDPFASHLFPVEYIPLEEERTVHAFKTMIATGHKEGKIGALIVEPLVQGAGGMRMYSPKVLEDLYTVCQEEKILFIADEVMTGFGRTGTMFACEQANITPDILCLSKGITGGLLPLGVTMVKPEIFQAFYSEDRKKTFFHGHSYSGNPIACAAALASFKVFEEEKQMNTIARISQYHKKVFAPRLQEHPKVANLRTCGTIAAIELQVKDGGYLSTVGPKLSQFYLQNGVLLRPLGNVVYILPPYCITDKELDRVYDVIEESLHII